MINSKSNNLEWILRNGIPGYNPWLDSAGYYLDLKEAKLRIDFFEECLHHIKGKFRGKLLKLEPWEKAIVGNLFGWKDKRTKLRRYREAFIFVAKKNGKTTLSAGFAIDGQVVDQEPAAEVYSASNDKDTAKLVFEAAKEMVKVEPELRKRCDIYKESIVCPASGSIYKPISKVPKHGVNPHRIIVDELHTVTDREMLNALVEGTAARTQPLTIYITTAGIGINTICYEKYDYAKKVRDGIIKDASFLPVIYEAEPEDDWTSELTWKKANPNLNKSVSLPFLRRAFKRAVEQPVYENVFRRLHLNQWTSAESRWIGAEDWRVCGGKIDIERLKGCDCYGGLDLTSGVDLGALALLFPLPEEMFEVLVWCWAPKGCLQIRERRDKVPYILWARQGFIEATTTGGRVLDYGFVLNRISQLAGIFRIEDIGYDRLFTSKLITDLNNEGLEMIPFGQGFKDMAAPAKTFEEMVLAQRIRHNNNPVLNWAMSNVTVEIDAAGNIKPSKKKSIERIDPVVAIIMAVGRWLASRASTFNADKILREVGI